MTKPPIASGIGCGSSTSCTSAPALTPYGSLEVTTTSTCLHKVNRYRLELGVTIPTGRWVEWDLYLGRQRDSGSETQYVNGFGITLNIKL